MLVLLFHAERSTWFGKESDRHSQAQAVRGIYARSGNFWVRGPAGVSKSSWHRANRQLEIDAPAWVPRETDPPQVPRVLTRDRHRHASGADAATEWAIDWLLIAEAIAEFRHTAPEFLPLLAEAPALSSEGGSPRVEHPRSQRGAPPCPTVGHYTSIRVSQPGTPTARNTRDPTQESAQRRREQFLASESADVARWLAAAWGTEVLPRRWAYIPGQVQQIAAKIGVHGRALEMWIRHLTHATNRRGYDVATPGFFVTATAQDLIRWARQTENRNACDSAAHDRNLALQRLAAPPAPGQLLSMPETAAEAALPPLPDLRAIAAGKRFTR